MKRGLILVTGSTRGDVELAKKAEAADFDSVFSIEFFNRHGYVVLGAVAEATSRIRFGSAIANSFTRTPLLHASAAMDLDELSGGRMILGLGSGTRRMNFRAGPSHRRTGSFTARRVRRAKGRRLSFRRRVLEPEGPHVLQAGGGP
jgi:alkanesulfonate monooxygenase SsuD/methylene tetrahydromethanopterin reductase-like flavin-dependent oxidoreductase (luciferase family)